MVKELILGDATLKLRFKVGILKHIKEISGKDPIDFISESQNNVFEFTSVVVNAGVRCQCDNSGSEYPDRDKVDKLISANMEMAGATEVIGWLVKDFFGGGEPEAQVAAE